MRLGAQLKLPGLLPDNSPKGYWTCPSASIFQLIRRRSLEVQIGMFLNKYVPGLRKREITTRNLASNSAVDRNRRTELFRNNVYDFPPLATCRKAYTESLQQDIEWPEQADWTGWPTHFDTSNYGQAAISAFS
jgi:hypothetical protein